MFQLKRVPADVCDEHQVKSPCRQSSLVKGSPARGLVDGTSSNYPPALEYKLCLQFVKAIKGRAPEWRDTQGPREVLGMIDDLYIVPPAQNFRLAYLLSNGVSY